MGQFYQENLAGVYSEIPTDDMVTIKILINCHFVPRKFFDLAYYKYKLTQFSLKTFNCLSMFSNTFKSKTFENLQTFVKHDLVFSCIFNDRINHIYIFKKKTIFSIFFQSHKYLILIFYLMLSVSKLLC